MQAQELMAQGQQNNALASSDPAVQAQGIQQAISKRSRTARQPGAIQMPDLSAQPGGTGGRGGVQKRLRSSQMNPPAQASTAPDAAPFPAGTPDPTVADRSDLESFGVTVAPSSGPSSVETPQPSGAGMIPVQRQTVQKEEDPEMEARRAERDQAQLAYLGAEKRVQEETAKLRSAEAAELQAQSEALQQRNADRQAMQDNAMLRMGEAISRYDNMEVQNPWSNRSTGARILAALSVAGSGFLARQAGQQGNPALDIINKSIQQDIDIQKANIDKQKGTITALQAYGQELRAMGVDDRAVASAMTAMAQKKTAAQIESLANQLPAKADGTPDPRSANYLKIAADLKNQAYEADSQNARAYASQTTLTEQPLISGPEVEGEKLDNKALEKFAMEEQSIKANEELIAAFEKKPKLLEQIGPIIGEFNRLRAKYFGDPDFAALDVELKDNLLVKLRQTTGAQMTNSEREFITQTVPTIGTNPENIIRLLKDRRKTVRDRYKMTHRMYSEQGWNMAGIMRPEDFLSVEDSVGFE